MLRHCAYIVTFVPSVLRCRLAETKPGARRTETSVAWVRSSMSRRWFAGSTVNTLIRVIISLFVEIVIIASLPLEWGETKARAASRHSMKRGAAAGTTAAGRGLDGSRDVGRQRTALNPITDGNCLPMLLWFGNVL